MNDRRNDVRKHTKYQLNDTGGGGRHVKRTQFLLQREMDADIAQVRQLSIRIRHHCHHKHFFVAHRLLSPIDPVSSIEYHQTPTTHENTKKKKKTATLTGIKLMSSEVCPLLLSNTKTSFEVITPTLNIEIK